MIGNEQTGRLVQSKDDLLHESILGDERTNKQKPIIDSLQESMIVNEKMNERTNIDNLVFNSRHRNQVTCSLLGGFSKPRAEVIQLLDSGLCSIYISI